MILQNETRGLIVLDHWRRKKWMGKAITKDEV